MSPPQSRRGSSRTAPPDQSSQADRPSRKSPQAACPHQKNRIDPSYPHSRILLRQLDSHKFRKAAIFRGALHLFAGKIGGTCTTRKAARQGNPVQRNIRVHWRRITGGCKLKNIERLS